VDCAIFTEHPVVKGLEPHTDLRANRLEQTNLSLLAVR